MRRSNRRAGLRRELVRQGIGLAGLGTALALLPWMLRATPFANAMGSASRLGLWIGGAGAVMTGLGLWMSWRVRAHARRAAPARAQERGRDADAADAARQAGADDRVADEIDRIARASRGGPFVPPARPTGWSPQLLEVIEWRRFEALVEAMYRQAGFETSSKPYGADGGVDVELWTPGPGARVVGLVQCKHRREPMGVDTVRALRGVMAERQVARGQFVASGGFTAPAERFARDNGIHLLDGPALLAWIGQRTPQQQRALLDVATDGEFWRPTCVRCGEKMVDRVNRQDGHAFWGCASYPRCRHRMPMRHVEARPGGPDAAAGPASVAGTFAG